MQNHSDDREWLLRLEHQLGYLLAEHAPLDTQGIFPSVFKELHQRSDEVCRECCRWLEDNCDQIAEHAALMMELLECVQSETAKMWVSRRRDRCEWLATLLAACGEPEWLAFLGRRGEVEDVSAWPLARLEKMLAPGVSRDSAMALVNLALALINRSGGQADWQRADELFARIPAAQASAVCLRWSYPLIRMEVEGLLVMYMLQRHGHWTPEGLPDAPVLRWYLRTQLPSTPDWMQDGWTPCLTDLYDGFTSIQELLVEAYLQNAPCTRAMAEELLEAIVQYDDRMLYDALLDEFSFAPLLTDEEREDVQARFGRLFDDLDDGWDGF